MRVKWYCIVGLGLYAVLSAADFVLTFTLLQANESAYESNPAAAACLEQHGWRGLALFKASLVAVFVAAVALLTRRQPVVGAAVVTLGCTVLLAVTSYTHELIRGAHEEEAKYSSDRSSPGGALVRNNPTSQWGLDGR